MLNKTRKPTDITATLIDLAVRGHLRIEEVGKGGGLARSNFRLVATPDRVLAKEQAAAHSGSPKPPPLLIHEQQLLSNLFDNGRTTVTLADLRNTFSSEMRMIGGSLDGWIERGGFFVDKFTGRHPVPLVVIAASVLTFIAMAVLQASFLAIPAGAAIGSAVVLGWSKKAVRRSALGHALYLQLEGFRLYIATAEADRIRFDEQDDVFSRYMPWAIVFGESERWARVFKELAEQGKFTDVPDWYAGSSGFSTGYLAGSMASMATIGSAMSSFSSIASSAMTSTPASSGSSGFSSGGGAAASAVVAEEAAAAGAGSSLLAAQAPRLASPLAAQRRDGLDVVGVREQVEGPQAHQLVAARGEQRDIPRQRHRIAGHVDQLGRRQSDECVDDGLARPGARRIEHHGRRVQPRALGRAADARSCCR